MSNEAVRQIRNEVARRKEFLRGVAWSDIEKLHELAADERQWMKSIEKLLDGLEVEHVQDEAHKSDLLNSAVDDFKRRMAEDEGGEVSPPEEEIPWIDHNFGENCPLKDQTYPVASILVVIEGEKGQRLTYHAGTAPWSAVRRWHVREENGWRLVRKGRPLHVKNGEICDIILEDGEVYLGVPWGEDGIHFFRQLFHAIRFPK